MLATLSGDRAVARASRAAFSDDLREVRLEGLRLSIRGAPELHVEVGEARVRGTGPFARALLSGEANVPPWLRATAGALASLLGALACATALLRSLDPRRLVALALGASSGLGPLWLLGALDRAPAQLAQLLHLALVPAALAPSLLYLGLRALGARAHRAHRAERAAKEKARAKSAAGRGVAGR